MVRVTGRFVGVEVKSGSKANASTGEIRDWTIHEAQVSVGGLALVGVSFNPETFVVPEVGAEVDWMVRVTGMYSGQPKLAFFSEWADALLATA